MERKSSINMQNMLANAFEHNTRVYNLKDSIADKSNNEYYSFINEKMFYSKQNKFKDTDLADTYKKPDFLKMQKYLEKKHKETTGKTAQKSTKWFKEFVVNTNEKTTIKDLKDMCKKLEEELNIKCLHISNHSDEGYIENGTKHINYHSHVLFINADVSTGITIKYDKAKLRKMQDIVADTLKMERGKGGKKRLEHKEYKQYINKKNEFENEVKLNNKFKDIQVNVLKKENAVLHKNVEQLVNKVDMYEKLFKEFGIDINISNKADLKALKALLKDKIEEEYKKEREALKTSQNATQKQYIKLKQKRESRLAEFNTILKNKTRDKQITR